MALVHAKGATIYLDALDLSGLTNSASISAAVDTAEVTTFASLAKEFLEGDYTATASFSTFYDNTDDGWDEQAWSKVTTQDDTHYLCVIPGSTAGTVCYELAGMWTGQPRAFDVGSAITIGGEMQGSGQLSRGGVNWTGAITATGAKTGVNHGATTSTQTIVVTYRILSVSGSGSIVFALEESSDNGSGDAYTAVAALASGTLSGVGVTVKTATAATEAWKRINVTTFSGFTSVTALVTVTVRQ